LLSLLAHCTAPFPPPPPPSPTPISNNSHPGANLKQKPPLNADLKQNPPPLAPISHHSTTTSHRANLTPQHHSFARAPQHHGFADLSHQAVTHRFLLGFGWLAVMGCGVDFEVSCDGWQWWFPFLVDSSGFGCGFFLLFCFTLLQTHNVEYFPKHFPRMQTNTEKKLFSLKSFAFENILQCKMFYIETNRALIRNRFPFGGLSVIARHGRKFLLSLQCQYNLFMAGTLA
jgi:hypothetical protein